MHVGKQDVHIVTAFPGMFFPNAADFVEDFVGFYG